MTELQSVERLSRDLRAASATMTDDEARYFVDYYYIMQEDRKRSKNQSLSMGQEPHKLLLWLGTQAETLENQIKSALDVYTKAHVMGSWMREIYGIGPVLSAGLLAHIDIKKAPTVGHIWRYAGLDPTQKWIGAKGAEAAVKELRAAGISRPEYMVELLAQRIGIKPASLAKIAADISGSDKLTLANLQSAAAVRPWNEKLHTLCWKVGQSFMKFSGAEECTYGKWYKQREVYEQTRNDSGQNRELAFKLKENFGKSTDAYGHLSEGRLPPAQIDARARRWAVKLFLSHMHNEWYRREFKEEPPKPYPIAHLGHAHYIPADKAA